MRAPPTWTVIEPLLMPLDAFPTNEVRRAFRSNELNHMIRKSIAALATLDCFVFRHLDLLSGGKCSHYQTSLARFQNAAVRQLAIDDLRRAGKRMLC